MCHKCIYIYIYNIFCAVATRCVNDNWCGRDATSCKFFIMPVLTVFVRFPSHPSMYILAPIAAPKHLPPNLKSWMDANVLIDVPLLSHAIQQISVARSMACLRLVRLFEKWHTQIRDDRTHLKFEAGHAYPYFLSGRSFLWKVSQAILLRIKFERQTLYPSRSVMKVRGSLSQRPMMTGNASSVRL